MANNVGGIKILTLNTRGLNNYKHKAKFLKHFIKKHKTDFIFLQETNLKDIERANKILEALGVNKGYFSLGGVGTGTATIQTSDLWTVTDSMTDDVTGRKTSDNNRWTE